ncbi:metallopeptidase [Synechococcus phage S-CREM2]|nr:metallopeptidase [Synechococcus phage S-CREM2]
MFVKLLSSVLAATVTLTASAPVISSPANPTSDPNNFQRHVELVQALEQVGVNVYFNHPSCHQPKLGKIQGYYLSQSKTMVICQDNARIGQEGVPFTANDLDTIRHEAQHVIQDCKDGIGNSKLHNVFPIVASEGEISLQQFVATSGLSEETLLRIFSDYSALGYSKEAIALEFEAFAVAHAVPAATIAEVLKSECGVTVSE